MSHSQCWRTEVGREGVVAKRNPTRVATVTGVNDAGAKVVLQQRVVEENVVTVEDVQSCFAERSVERKASVERGSIEILWKQQCIYLLW